MATPHNRCQWQKILSPLLTDSLDQYIYLQITRGVAAKRDHAFPSPAIEPTIFAMASPISHLAGKEKGVKAITLDDTRWDLCHVKATTLLANILLRQQAVEQHCAEAILVKNGQVTEGAASNVFAVINNVLTTPPQSNEILPGITRKIILDLAHNNQLATAERNFTLVDLKSASEIWLTSSTREILPVVKLDSETVQKGRPGPVWQAMHTLFQDYKRSVS
jgi:D-alanine transaminase